MQRNFSGRRKTGGIVLQFLSCLKLSPQKERQTVNKITMWWCKIPCTVPSLKGLMHKNDFFLNKRRLLKIYHLSLRLLRRNAMSLAHSALKDVSRHTVRWKLWKLFYTCCIHTQQKPFRCLGFDLQISITCYIGYHSREVQI